VGEEKCAPLPQRAGGGGAVEDYRNSCFCAPHKEHHKGEGGVSRRRTGRFSSRSSIPGTGIIFISPPQLPDPASWSLGAENVFCVDKAAGT
jgi:hypothetical protein